MKKDMNRANLITVILFCGMLALFFYIGVLAPKDMSAAERENRELKPMPAFNAETVFSGTFSKDFEDYLADNVGYRSFFMDISAKIDALKGIKTESGKIVSANKDLGTGVQGENQLLILSDRVMEVYKKDDAARDAYIQSLNGYAETLPESVRMFSMLVPTQIEFYEKQTVADSEKDTIDTIYKNLNDRITTVDAYSALKAGRDEYIYFRTDHHWTQRGAFLGYSAFCKAAFSKTPNLSDYKENSRDGFLGYLYNQANDVSLASHADSIEWFEKGENVKVEARAFEDGKFVDYETKMYTVPLLSEKPKYSLFMGGDHQFAKMHTKNTNGKTLLVIKDSYANALLPLLTEDYETILVIDPRNYYGKVTDLISEYNVDDCLFINYVFTTTFSDFVGKLNEVK